MDNTANLISNSSRRGNTMRNTETMRCLTLAATLAAALLVATPGAAQAQWKPEKNVEVVVGLAAGSFQDHTGRMIQKVLQEQRLLGVTSSVVNRVGAGGIVAWAYLAQHAGDPQYLLVTSPSILTAHITGASQYSYTDFTPLAMLSSQYIALAVNASSPIKSGRDLMERLKKDITSVTFANNGLGNNLHILIALVAKSAGVDAKKLKVAIFQGGGELTTAVLGGHVDVISTATSNILPHLQAGKLRIIGIASARRLGGALATIPTWKEQGVDAVVPNWSGVMAPKGLTPAQLAWWDDVFAKVVKSEDWKNDLERNFQEPEYLASADAAAYLRTQYAQLKAALSDLGLAK
jgi:putative tricarboxylic transport membrane protein